MDITGGSRQILGGTIPRVAVAATGAVYQGLSLGSIDLIAENIRINLPQVLKGKPLQLLEPIGVLAEVKFSESDLQASLAAPLLSQAITDLFAQILAKPQETNWVIDWDRLEIAPHTLILKGNLTTGGQTAPIEIVTGLAISSGHILHLNPLKINCVTIGADGKPCDLPGSDLTSHRIDLGNDVNITQLQLITGELICQGRIQVNP